MSTRRRTFSDRARGTGVFGDHRGLAPSLERTWLEDFVVELRLLGVPGDAIGDALVTAQTHVQESGETAQEAFGDARSYAREIAESSGTASEWTPSAADVVGNIAGLVGMLVTVAAFTAWLDGAAVTVTVGTVVGLGVLLALMAVLLLRPAQVARSIVDHRSAFAVVAPVVLVGAFVAVLLLFPQALFAVAALPLGVLGVALVAVSALIVWTTTDDAQVEITEPGRAPQASARSRLVSVAAFPAITALLLVFTWTLSLIV